MIYIYIVFIALVVLSIILFIVFFNRKQRKNQNKLLSSKKEIVCDESEELTVAEQNLSETQSNTEIENGKFEDFSLEPDKKSDEKEKNRNPFFTPKYVFEDDDEDEIDDIDENDDLDDLNDEDFDLEKYKQLMELEKKKMLANNRDFDIKKPNFQQKVPEELKSVLFDKNATNKNEEDE